MSGVRVSCPPSPCNGTTFFCRCLLGAFLSICLTKIEILDGTLRYCVVQFQRPTTTTSILRPIRSRFYVQFDLNHTSNSISILRPIRPQFYVQFDLNLRPDRSQWDTFFLPTVRSWGDMKLPLATVRKNEITIKCYCQRSHQLCGFLPAEGTGLTQTIR